MLSLFLTLVIVGASLLILLLNIGCTGMFTNGRPTGDQAMGLAVPIFGLPIGIVALTGAALLTMARVSTSAMGTIAPTPEQSGLLVIVITFGAALAAGMAFMLWCEPAAVAKSLAFATAPIGIIAGVCGPVVLAIMLLTGVWMSRSYATETLASPKGGAMALKAGFVALCLLACVGYALGGSMLWKGVRLRAARQAAKIAELRAHEAKWEAHRSKSPRQRITDEFADFSDTSPLWSILVYFLDQDGIAELDAECRALVVERALKTPDFDAQLASCLKTQYHIYRTAAAEFLVNVPDAQLAARRDAWGYALIGGVHTTRAEMEGRPGWLSETPESKSKPDPIDHVRSLLRAAARFKDWDKYGAIREGFASMASAAGKLNDVNREKLVNVLADAGYRASTSG